jgi:hypothetical protein
MLALAFLSALLGGVIALRSRAFALIPVISLVLAIVATAGVLRGEGAWSIVQSMAMVWVSVQVGYLCGAILRTASWASLGGRPDSSERSREEQRTLMVAVGGIVLAIGWVIIRWLTA